MEDKKQEKKEEPTLEPALPANLPPEMQQKVKDLQEKLSHFQKEVLKKFEDYILGIAIVPPPLDKAGKPVDEEKVHLLVMVDDTDSKKMSKFELRDKLTTIITELATKTDAAFKPEIVLISEFWQNCFDGKYELSQLIAMSAPVYDKGIMGAIKLGEVHKSMVIKKFEKYIVSYALFGSVARNEARPESDIDVAIIIDDTDVKKMTRAELKDKLRAIIIGMGMEASQITGIKKAFNIQIYILTEFWEFIKESHPVMFTILRDGVPFYDRGMFMPWKQLLKMGRIKPSREAIDIFMSTGEQMVSRTRRKLLELVEADIYWSTLTPTQAALMMYGIPPPNPKETVDLVEEIFVKKEKLLEKKYLDIMKLIRDYYKKLEHGELKSISGKEVDDLITKADDYLKRIKKLFSEIEILKQEEQMVEQYDHACTILRDALKIEGIESAPEKDLVKLLDEKLISTGKLAAKDLTLFKKVIDAKKKFDTGKLTKTGIEQARKDYKELVQHVIELVQRSRARDVERAKIRIKYGDKYGEIILFDDIAFITPDLDSPTREVQKAAIKKDGSLGKVETSDLEELESHLAKLELPASVFIKQPVFESIKKLFGDHVEILVNRA